MLQNIQAYAVGASFVSNQKTVKTTNGAGVWIYIYSFQKSTNHRRFAALHLSRPLKAPQPEWFQHKLDTGHDKLP